MADVITLGYSCPLCGKHVPVIRSSAPPRGVTFFYSECKCGYTRGIQIGEVQELEVWKEEKAA